jgi:hypothetical protein
VKRRLHLVRAGAVVPEAAIVDSDWVVDLEALALADRGTPPLPVGPVTYDLLVELVTSADLVITW